MPGRAMIDQIHPAGKSSGERRRAFAARGTTHPVALHGAADAPAGHDAHAAPDQAPGPGEHDAGADTSHRTKCGVVGCRVAPGALGDHELGVARRSVGPDRSRYRRHPCAPAPRPHEPHEPHDQGRASAPLPPPKSVGTSRIRPLRRRSFSTFWPPTEWQCSPRRESHYVRAASTMWGLVGAIAGVRQQRAASPAYDGDSARRYRFGDSQWLTRLAPAAGLPTFRACRLSGCRPFRSSSAPDNTAGCRKALTARKPPVGLETTARTA